MASVQPLAPEDLRRHESRRILMVNAADHVGLVYTIAQRYRHQGVEVDELVAEGTIGLMSAVRKFDPARGIAFSTYAAWWISSAIARYLLVERVVHLPHNVVAKRQKDGTLRREASLDKTIFTSDDGQTFALLDLIASDSIDPLSEAMTAQRAERVKTSIQKLPQRTRNVLRLRFEEDVTLEEIAQVYGLCRERVRQILENAFDVLYGELSYLE
jgi:RNA polymerase sigma factor (sigma-70 family)